MAQDGNGGHMARSSVRLPSDPQELRWFIVQAQQRAAQFLLLQGRALRRLKTLVSEEDWNTEIAAPELALSRAEARQLMTVTGLIDAYEIPDDEAVQIPFAKIVRVAPRLRALWKDGRIEEARDVWADAKTLSRSDLREKYITPRTSRPRGPDATGKAILDVLAVRGYRKSADGRSVRLEGPRGAVRFESAAEIRGVVE